MDWLETAAVVAGLAAVGLTVRQSIWCWPFGLVQVSLYVVVFFRVRLYSDVILHVIYVGLQIYGWYHWLRGGRDRGRLPVGVGSLRSNAGWLALIASTTLLWGYTVATLTEAAVPYGDAFTTVTSLVAQWLMARKVVDSWCYWIAVDVVAIGIYQYKGLLLTAGLYAVFLLLCLAGLRSWWCDRAAARGIGAVAG